MYKDTNSWWWTGEPFHTPGACDAKDRHGSTYHMLDMQLPECWSAFPSGPVFMEHLPLLQNQIALVGTSDPVIHLASSPDAPLPGDGCVFADILSSTNSQGVKVNVHQVCLAIVHPWCQQYFAYQTAQVNPLLTTGLKVSFIKYKQPLPAHQ